MSAVSLPGRSMPSPSSTPSIVFIVDDDISVRESLELLIGSQGWQAKIFESAKEFLDRTRDPCSKLPHTRRISSGPQRS